MLQRFLGLAVLALSLAPFLTAQDGPRVRIKFKNANIAGNIDLILLPDDAPLTVANFMKYVNRGAYTELLVHRSVSGFVWQTGGYQVIDSDWKKIPADPAVRNEYKISNTRGTVAMAKLGNNPNSATTEFFINMADNSANLNSQNGGFTVFARVADEESMANADKIAALGTLSAFSIFTDFPVYNYRGSVGLSNLVVIESITLLDPQPAITENGIVSASAFGGLNYATRGSYIEIYGSNLAGTERAWEGGDFADGKAPTALSGVSVTVGGVPAFVNFISAGQVNVQVPQTAPLGDAVPVVVTYRGIPSKVANIAIKSLAGGLLAPSSFKVGDTQFAAAVHATTNRFVSNGSIPETGNEPAKPGETIIFYGTGFGAVNPSSFQYAGTVASEIMSVAADVKFKIGDRDAAVHYAGLSPGLVGVYQFNVTVPADAPSGDLPVAVTLAGEAIPQNLFLSVASN